MRRELVAWLRRAGDALRGGFRGLVFEAVIVAAMSIAAFALAVLIRLAV